MFWSFIIFPTFHTVPPRIAPKITGIENSYRSGDLVDVICHSADSKPAARLTWKINGDLVKGDSWIVWTFKICKFLFLSFLKRPLTVSLCLPKPS